MKKLIKIISILVVFGVLFIGYNYVWLLALEYEETRSAEKIKKDIKISRVVEVHSIRRLFEDKYEVRLWTKSGHYLYAANFTTEYLENRSFYVQQIDRFYFRCENLPGGPVLTRLTSKISGESHSSFIESLTWINSRNSQELQNLLNQHQTIEIPHVNAVQIHCHLLEQSVPEAPKRSQFYVYGQG